MTVGAVTGVCGQIGVAVARQMLERGWQVRGLDRPGKVLPDDLSGVTLIAGARDDESSFAALVGTGADVLVDTVAFDARDAAQLLAHQGDIGSLAVISSIAVYADDSGSSMADGEPRFPVPMTESQRLVAGSEESYGGRKVLLEGDLLNNARTPTSILRPAALCGAYSAHLREWWLIKRGLDGRKVVPMRFAGSSQFHPSSTANVAALALHCADLGGNHVVNAADPDCPTAREIAIAVGVVMSHDWEVVSVPDGDRQKSPVGETPWTTEHSMVLDTSLSTALGYQPVHTYLAGLAALVDAGIREVADKDWRAVYPGLAEYAGFDYAAEDDYLAS